MQICILVGRVLLAGLAWVRGWASATRWANFEVRNFQTWTNGWASGTSWASSTGWASESEPETCIFELNLVVF